MSIDDMVRDDLIRKVEVIGKSQSDELMKIAGRDIVNAKKQESYDWMLAIAYNAMLSAGKAYMLSRGYRPVSGKHHYAISKFLEETIGYSPQFIPLIMERMRKKRHRVVYETAGAISEKEAKDAIKYAESLVEEIKLRLSKESKK